MRPKPSRAEKCISNFSLYSNVIIEDPFDDIERAKIKQSKSTKKRLRRHKKKKNSALVAKAAQIKKVKLVKKKAKKDLKIIMDKLSNI